MSIQSNFPSARPSLLLDFANTKQLDPRITFTRASTGNYYDGKTAAMAEQNGIYPSANLASSAQTSAVTITNNITGVTAPDGTETVSKFVPTSASTLHYARAAGGLDSVTLNVPYTFSFYAKAAGLNFVTAQLSGGYGSGGGRYAITVDLSNGVINGFTANQNISGTSASVTFVNNGWYRISITGSPTSQNSTPLATGYIVGATAYNSTGASNGGECTPVTYGDGTNGVYVWGFQVEQRSTVSAYTATTSVPITNYIPVQQSAASGVPRFDTNPTTNESLGLLIEQSSTNLILGSSQFETSVWTQGNSSIASNIDVAPDGTFTADKLIENSSSSTHITYQIGYGSSSVTGTYTFSAYLKAGERTKAAVSLGSGTDLAKFDLSSGTVISVVTGTANIQSVGNGWYRCSYTATVSAIPVYGWIACVDSSNNTSYTGNGYSGIYIWGAQLEAASSATSYIATPLTFTSRASSATYLGSNGYITSASTNVARNQTNSVGTTNLLLESAASNLLTYTDDFANSVWSKVDCTTAVNQKQSPDGLTFADKLVENVGTVTPRYERSVAVTSGVQNTFSIYLKAGERSSARLYCSTGSPYALAWFNLNTGTIGTTDQNPLATMIAIGGGWYRCSITFTPTTTTQTVQVLVGNPAETPTYTGNGTSGIYVWGAQVEAGSTATSYIPSVETFSGRSSSGTYYNSSGVLSTATSGTSRTTYNPALLGAGGKLLLEPAATNLHLYSEVFDNAAWGKSNVTVTANAVAAPDGNTTADKIVVDTTTNYHFVYQTYTTTAQSYTTSIYAKAAEYSFLQIANDTASANNINIFDLSSGTVVSSASGQTASIQFVGNGWYRCSVTFTGAALSGRSIYYGGCPTSTSITFTGTSGSGIYVWGAQFETGSGATSYIATTASSVTRAADTSTSAAQSRSADVYSASTVTRAADAASMTGANLTSWFRTDSGTFYSDGIRPAGNNLAAYWSFDAGYFDMLSSTSNVNFRYGSGSGPDLVFSGSFTTTRAAGSYQPNANHSLSVNGGTTITSNTVGTVNAVTTFRIGYGSAGSTFYLNGPVKKIAYYPLTLTDAQLQALTS